MLTNENGRKTKRLSREILGLLLITAVIALFFWGFLYLTANSISETYFTERNLQPSEGQWLTLRAWIRSVSLLSTVILFLVLFLFLLGQKLAYLREIIQGVDALRTHRLEDTIPLREANELTELAEHINFLSETERRLRQQEMALQAERERMIRDLSHDIRTPLTAIMGLSATVEESETLTDEGRGMVEEIHQNAQWLLHLSENILSVTRFCDEGVVIEKSDEVVEEIVGSAIRRFRKNCDTDIPITVSKPEEILLAPMDATLIEQVLLNLLENVAKHSPSATEVFIEIRAEGRRVWLTVADNGDGIPPQLLGVLFDGYLPLGAVEASDRSRHMGIGLSVCRAIVRAHGGEIYARNKIDGGAEFRFWLPAEEESNT